MAKFISGRQRKLSVGIKGYTDNKVVFDTVGRVGINTNVTPSHLSVIGNAYISGNLGLGVSNPTTAKITFGESSLNIGIIKGSTSLRLFEKTNGFYSSDIYGFGVNDDSFFGGSGIGVTFLDICANSPDAGIRFFAGSYAFNPTEVLRITPQGFVGIGTNDPQYKLTVEGSIKSKTEIVASSYILNNYDYGDYEIVSQNRVLQNIADFDDGISDLISFKVANNPKPFVHLTVTGIATFRNGPVLVNAVEPSGTENQFLQVVGGVYAEGNVGIGITNPTEKLSIMGDISIKDNVVYGSDSGISVDTAEFSIFLGLSTSLYRFVEFNVQASNQNNFHYTKMLVLHDGLNVYTTEYATVYNNKSLASYDVRIVDDNLSLVSTPTIADLIDYKIYYVASKII